MPEHDCSGQVSITRSLALGKTVARRGEPHAAARSISAANLDSYEAAIRALTELEWMLAGALVTEPIRSMAAAWADLTRDIAAVQLSIARWVLDV